MRKENLLKSPWLKAKGKSPGQKVRQRNSEFPDRRWTRRLSNWGSRNTRLWLSSIKSTLSIPGNPALAGVPSSNFSSKPFVSVICMWSPCCIYLNRKPRWQRCSNATGDWAKQHNHDLEDREISAAGIHGFYAKRAYEDGAGRGAERAFRYGLPKHHSRLARDAAGGPRRSEVPKEL